MSRITGETEALPGPSTSVNAEECGRQLVNLTDDQQKNGATERNVKEIVSQLFKNPEKISLVMGLLNDSDNMVSQGGKVTRSMTRNASLAPLVNLKPITGPKTFLDYDFQEDDDEEEYIPTTGEKSIHDDMDANSIFSHSDLDSEVNDTRSTYQLRSHSHVPEISDNFQDDVLYYSVVDNEYVNFIGGIGTIDSNAEFADYEEPDDTDFVPTEAEVMEEVWEEHVPCPRSEVEKLITDLIDVPQNDYTFEVTYQQEVHQYPLPQTSCSDSLLDVQKGYVPHFTEQERKQLRDQMAMHVQQLMQTIMITHDTDGLQEDKDECIKMMQDLLQEANSSPLSHFAVPNLIPAVDTLEAFLTQMVVWPDIFSSELFKSHFWQFPSHKVMWTLANSTAIVYPELLVIQRAQDFREPLNKFLESENLLLALALIEFRHIKHSSCANRNGKNHLISKLLIINKSSSQIKYHMKNIRKKTAEIYQLITMAEKGDDVQFPMFFCPRIDNGPPLNWSDGVSQPFWLKELRKSLNSRPRHRTVTELPRQAVIQVASNDGQVGLSECVVQEHPVVVSDAIQHRDPDNVLIEVITETPPPAPLTAEQMLQAERIRAAIAELDYDLGQPSNGPETQTEVLEEGHVDFRSPEKMKSDEPQEKPVGRPDESFVGNDENATISSNKQDLEPENIQTEVGKHQEELCSPCVTRNSDDINVTETEVTFDEVNIEETCEADISQEMDEELERLHRPEKSPAKVFRPRNEDSLLWINNDDESQSCSTFQMTTPTPCTGTVKNNDQSEKQKTPMKYYDPWGEDSMSVQTRLNTPQFARERPATETPLKSRPSASRRVFEIDPPTELDCEDPTMLSPAKRNPSRKKETDLEKARCATDTDRRDEQMSILAQVIWEDVCTRLNMHDIVLSELQKIIEEDIAPDAVIKNLRCLIDKRQDAVLYIIAFLIPRKDWPEDLKHNHSCLNLCTALQRILVIEAFNSKAIRRSAIKNIFAAIARLADNCIPQQLYDKLNKHFGSHKILWSQLEELFPEAAFKKKVTASEYEHQNLYDSDHGEDVEQFERVEMNYALGKPSNRIVHEVTIDKGRVLVRRDGRHVQVDLTSGKRRNLVDEIEEFEVIDVPLDSIPRKRKYCHRVNSETEENLDEAALRAANKTAHHYAEQHFQTATYGNRVPWTEENDDAMIECLDKCEHNIESSVQMYVTQKLHVGQEEPTLQEVTIRLTMLKGLVEEYIATKEATSITLR